MKTSSKRRAPRTSPVAFIDDGEPDHLWALDHSRRRFRVRPMRATDGCDVYQCQIGVDVVVIDLWSVGSNGPVSWHEEETFHPDDFPNPTPGRVSDSDAWAAKVWANCPWRAR
jgi:hypothetical protein